MLLVANKGTVFLFPIRVLKRNRRTVPAFLIF